LTILAIRSRFLSIEAVVFQLFHFLLPSWLLKPILRPLTRFFLGFIAIPIFRVLLRKVVRVQEINAELDKDLEQWFRGSLLLLVATYNMEGWLFEWVKDDVRFSPLFMAGRLLLAIGVIEGMPDQALFALIHPGPQKPVIEKGHLLRSLVRYLPLFLKGLICQHLNRSSPVLAILSVLHKGEIGWICYGVAIAQYLIIGLVASKDKALDVLTQFDAVMARQRQDLETELSLPVSQSPLTPAMPSKTVDEGSQLTEAPSEN
jgi:hypothetical protein